MFYTLLLFWMCVPVYFKLFKTSTSITFYNTQGTLSQTVLKDSIMQQLPWYKKSPHFTPPLSKNVSLGSPVKIDRSNQMKNPCVLSNGDIETAELWNLHFLSINSEVILSLNEDIPAS